MIKLIAMAAMLIDHIGAVFFPGALWLRIIGRLSFPLFAWGIAMGSRRTRNWKRYAARLLIIALVTQLPYYLLFRTEYWNVCFTLLSGLLALRLMDLRSKPLKIAGLLSILALVHFLNFEYGIYGVLTIMVFYYYKDDNFLPLYQGLLSLGGVLIYRLHEIQLLSAASSFLIPVLEREDFPLKRWVQYGFYPIHIILLLVIKTIAGL